eukprot:4492802-Amphidinium_carterae.1
MDTKLKDEEASLLLQCGSFWPDSMVDRSAFVKMLLHVLNVEAGTDHQVANWEEELTASGACNASGVVDVKHFAAFCLQGGIKGTGAVLGVLPRPQQEDKTLAAPSEPSNEMLAAANPQPARDPDKTLTLSTLRTAVIIGKQKKALPSLEDQAGAVVVVHSKEYVLGETLGQGGGGS